MSDTLNPEDILAYTTEIIAAHATRNEISAKELPGLIKNVYRTLADLGTQKTEEEKEILSPAVPVNKSVFPDYIVCLEDGKKLKMLKRHLKSTYNMTGKEYKERWNLPDDYPLVAPNYANRRSELAKQIGLGKKRK